MSKAQIAYQEAMRALVTQDGRLNVLRTTGLALTSLSVALVPLYVRGDGSRAGWFYVAATFAALAVALAVWMHVPVVLWDTFSASDLVMDYVDDPDIDTDVMLRDLALHAETLWDRNEKALRARRGILLGVIVVLAMEVGALALNTVT